MRGLGERADIGAGAEHVVLAGADHHRTHLRVLEAEPLHRIGQLDIDPEIVGIEFQLGAGKQAAGRIDVERQGRNRPVAGKAPVSVLTRLGRKVDVHQANIAPIRSVP